VEKYLKFPNINRTPRHRIIQPKKFWKKIFSSGTSERESQIELHLNLRILASDNKTTRVSILASKKQYTKITFLRLFFFSALSAFPPAWEGLNVHQYVSATWRPF
jgi:hypothetical protein